MSSRSAATSLSAAKNQPQGSTEERTRRIEPRTSRSTCDRGDTRAGFCRTVLRGGDVRLGRVPGRPRARRLGTSERSIDTPVFRGRAGRSGHGVRAERWMRRSRARHVRGTGLTHSRIEVDDPGEGAAEVELQRARAEVSHNHPFEYDRGLHWSHSDCRLRGDARQSERERGEDDRRRRKSRGTHERVGSGRGARARVPRRSSPRCRFP